MSDLIDRQQAINTLYKINPSSDFLFIDAIVDMLENLPEQKVKVVSGVKSYGDVAYYIYMCEKCHNPIPYKQIGMNWDEQPNYCSNCGAKLEWSEKYG